MATRAIIAEMALEKRSGCRFLRLDDERSYRRIGVVHLKNHYQTRPQRALVECLRKVKIERAA